MTSGPARLAFIGTATAVLRIGDFTLVTDPNFLHRGQRAYLGYGMWSKRRTEPSAGPQDLPTVDGVVLSHLHGDHFDRVARRGLPHSTPVTTTPQAARALQRWGFEHALGLQTWSRTELAHGDQRLQITAVPGRHGPGPVDWLLPTVMGSVIELYQPGDDPVRIYITGDTLLRPMLAEIPRRCGHIDAMVIHLGGTRILGLLVTMDGRQGAGLVDLLRPGTVVPVHFDDYGVFKSPRSQFLEQAARLGHTGRLRIVERGQTVSLVP
jgi:L-ascorbate metabolism protein UlaG (beta-lactamase superfamily)